ncbi:amidohydrolase family protein [Rhodococcus sp. NPDC058514]|uniref:metal-dependent hydrolase family protein n=1 Tax=unclassified Rhodococcus (in: high G+C Gram-positive bacteria) TaxID=192944 RepID=UPI0036507FF7
MSGDAVGTVHTDWTVIVNSSGTIEYAGPSAQAQVPTGHRIIDGTGRFLMPGIINAHAHLFADGKPLPKIYTRPRTAMLATKFLHSPAGRWMLRRRTKTNVLTQLHTGVTTIRSVGDVGDEVIEARNAIERGEYVGPRLLPSGPLMAITGGHGAPQIAHVCDVPSQGRRSTRENLDRGAQTIKISATGGVTDATEVGHAGKPEMSEEGMQAICEEAHARGVLVAAHAQGVEGVIAALRAGVDTIEHGSSMNDEAIALYKNNPNSLRGYSAMIPTLQACLPLVKLPQSVTGADDIVLANAKLVLEEMVSGIQSALDNDIVLGMGTDSAVTYVTHSNTWRELDLLVRYGGLTPAQALHAATQTNAQILGLEDRIGSIEPGKDADMVLLDANPLDTMRTLAAPRTVVVRGALIEEPRATRLPEIDAQLDTF